MLSKVFLWSAITIKIGFVLVLTIHPTMLNEPCILLNVTLVLF